MRVTRGLLIIIAGIGVAASPMLGIAEPQRGAGAVFAMTNDASKNEVIAYERAADGSLSNGESYETGGRGSGGINDPLGSQGSLTLSQDRSLLFAANAGSGNISVFSVRGAHLTLLNKVPSGGSSPVAVAEYQDLVYVLNSGDAGSIVAFHLDFGGQLKEIKNSTVFLTGDLSGGSSLAISPSGQFLVATERQANNIDTFRIKPDGTLGPIVVNANPAPGTFSVRFTPSGQLIATETGPASEPNGSAESSYSVLANGKLSAISQSLPTLGAANCWNIVTPDSKFVYTSNSGTSTIAGFAIAANGTLTPIGSTIVGSNPEGIANLDLGISADGKFIYSLNSVSGNIGIFEVQKDGTLESLGEVGNLPKSAGIEGLTAF
jgi:6-phosphogluconolactonase